MNGMYLHMCACMTFVCSILFDLVLNIRVIFCVLIVIESSTIESDNSILIIMVILVMCYCINYI